MIVHKLKCIQDNWTLPGELVTGHQKSFFIKAGSVVDHIILYNRVTEVVIPPPPGYFWSKIPDSPDFTLHLLIYYKTLEQLRDNKIDQVLC